MSIYEDVTRSIVEKLEAGVAPWVRPWGGGSGGLPFNALTHKTYRGINTICLWSQCYADSRWITYKQAQAMGWQVKKGAKGSHIVFWTFLEKGEAGEESREGAKKKHIPMARRYTVFNALQCDRPDDVPVIEKLPTMDAAAEVFSRHHIAIHDYGLACYSPDEDRVCMPPLPSFENESLYWSVALHEAGHWTGHKNRLNRDLNNRFGSQAYAAEELIAELASAFSCAVVGVPGTLRHPEYIAAWLKILKNDMRAIFTAASHAQKAADFLVASKPVDETPSELELAEVAA